MKQTTRCKHCKHLLLQHLGECWIPDCKCPGFEPEEAKPIRLTEAGYVAGVPEMYE